MHITGSNQRLVQLFGQLCHLEIEIYQILITIDIRKSFLSHKKFIIANRLDFQIIIKGGNLQKLFLWGTSHNSPHQFSRLTGRANNQTLPILLNQLLGQSRTLEEKTQIGHGNQLVKISQTNRILGQNNNMVGPFLLIILTNQIPLYTIDNLDTCILGSRHGIWKGLNTAMIRNGNSRPAPFGRSLNQGLGGRNRIHGAHIGMAMQFHPLFLSLVLTSLLLHQHQRIRHQAIIIAIGIVADSTLNLNDTTRLSRLFQTA